MKRELNKTLIRWKKSVPRGLFIVEGPHHVGKTHLLLNFGKEYFENTCHIDLTHPDFARLLNKHNTPEGLLHDLQLVLGNKIVSDKVLIFFDNMQLALKSLPLLAKITFLNESLSICMAGHRLELQNLSSWTPELKQSSQHHFLSPFSFSEFLYAKDQADLDHFLAKINVQSRISPDLHQKLIDLTKDYLLVGGMPEVIATHKANPYQTDYQDIQKEILLSQRHELEDQTRPSHKNHILKVWDKIPNLIGEIYKHAQVDRATQSRDLKKALQAYFEAGFLHKISMQKEFSQSNIPIIERQRTSEPPFKTLFTDTGLLVQKGAFSKSLVLAPHLLDSKLSPVFRQFVGQELLHQQTLSADQPLKFWRRQKRGSSAEIDYMLTVEGQTFPIIIRSGKVGTLKALNLYLAENPNVPFGIRLHSDPPSKEGKIFSLPLYAACQLRRIIKQNL